MRKHHLLLNKFLQGTMVRLLLATLLKWREKLEWGLWRRAVRMIKGLEQLLYKERLNRFRSFSWKRGE